jgi:hypothetical protein
MSDGQFAGVDWASEEHAACVIDEHGRIVEGRRYRHDETGIRALCARLVRLGVELVALERPDGLLIERLLDAGLAVIAVHLNQVKAMRPRYSVAGGKSDGFDSFVLAQLARTDPDGATFRSLFIAHDSWLCAATMLAEIGDCRDRYPSYRTLAADAGQSTVAVESGKAKRAQFRVGTGRRVGLA